MLFASVCQGSSAAAAGSEGEGVFVRDSGCSVHMGVLALPVYPLMSTGSGSRRCACRWTRPLGGVGGLSSLLGCRIC